MSSIVSADNTALATETISPDGGLDVVGLQDVANEIEIKGDAPAGIVGGGLADTITTGAGDADVFGGAGNDTIIGGTGNDILRGGDGDDVIMGGLGDDFILGGAGNDTIKGGFGSDTLNGGEGDDVFEFAISEFADGSMDEIQDFKDDGADAPSGFADMIKIFDQAGGIGDVTYDAATGMVSIDGEEAIDIGEGADVTIEKNENNTWELF